MDPSVDQSNHPVQDVPSDPQESTLSDAQPEDPSAVSCDTHESHPNPDSEPTDDAPVVVVDPFDDTAANANQQTELPTKSESVQTTDETPVAQQLKFGPYSDRYLPHHNSYRLSRDLLREIAAATLDALDDGFYYPPPTKDVEQTEVQQVESEKDGKETEVDGMEQEEGTEEEVGDIEKGDNQPEAQDGTETHSEGQDAVEVDHRKAGREPYDLKTKIWNTNENTLFISPDDEVSSLWFQTERSEEDQKKSRIIIAEYSTLVGSRRLQKMTNDEAGPKGKIGVLNFASAKRAGGGFLNGAQAQEESLARSSTLYPSLLTPTAKQFYRIYSADPDNAFYSHAMVYSPSVILFRDDKGDWTAPIEVDILTSAAVNAGDVRKQVRWEEEMRALRERVRVAELARRRELSLPAFVPTHVRIYESEPQRDEATESGQISLTQSEQPTSVQVSPIIFASDPPSPPLEPLPLPASDLMPPSSPLLVVDSAFQTHSPSSVYPHPPNVDPLTHAENLIAAAMQERIARILYLFQLQGAKHLVLGSFGTGVFQNSVELIARIFRDLLCDPENEDERKGKEKEKEKDTKEGDDDDGDGDGDGDDEGEEREETPFISVVSPKCQGKFKDVFDTVMFAILGGSTVETFRNVFEGAEGVEFDEEADDSDVEGMKDASSVRAQGSETCNPPA